MAEQNSVAPKSGATIKIAPKSISTTGTTAPVEEKDMFTRNPIVTCIAAGQGGYNGMRAMLEYPFCSPENCFYLNYKTDLTAAKLLDPANRININPNSFGAGKSRDKAKADATQAMELWSKELRSKINPKTEKIYIFTSAGGGFGSGAGPLISAIVSQDNFLDHKGRTIPVEVITFKPALSANREEWYNYSEALKEYNALVNAKAISLYIADLSSCDSDDPIAAAEAVDKEVARLLYRFDALNYLSSSSNLDFEDRYVLATTPKMRGLLTYDPVEGSYSTPFVMPKGELVSRLGCEIPETDESKIDAFIRSFGVTVLDRSFKGLYPKSAESKGAQPVVFFAGYNVPEAVLAESNDVVTELNRKAESLAKNDEQKTKGIFDMQAENKNAIRDSNARGDQDIASIMNLIS